MATVRLDIYRLGKLKGKTINRAELKNMNKVSSLKPKLQEKVEECLNLIATMAQVNLADGGNITKVNESNAREQKGANI